MENNYTGVSDNNYPPEPNTNNHVHDNQANHQAYPHANPQAHQQSYPGYNAHPGAPVMPPAPGMSMPMPGHFQGSPVHHTQVHQSPVHHSPVHPSAMHHSPVHPSAMQQSPHMQGQPVMIVQQTATPTHTQLGPSSSFAKCPSCQASGYTRADRGFNSTGWIICFLLYLFTLCCFWCAMCCDSNYEVRHYCSNCGYRIGTYNG